MAKEAAAQAAADSCTAWAAEATKPSRKRRRPTRLVSSSFAALHRSHIGFVPFDFACTPACNAAQNRTWD